MHLKNLRLKNFRNHLDSSLFLDKRTNILVGNNGQGKTNILEGISYLCLTKSFFTAGDSSVINFNSSLFEISGIFETDEGAESKIRVSYSKEDNKKVYSINKKRIEPMSEVIGRFPIVICSPEHAPITTEGPAERRKFFNLVISQSDNQYFHHLLEYKHILRQRNKILFDWKISGKPDHSAIEPWNEQLVKHGGHLILKRRNFVNEFNEFIVSAYAGLVGSEENPRIEYAPSVKISGADAYEQVVEKMSADITRKFNEEKKFGTTLIGPHRDEFQMTVNGHDIRKFASQGQHKTFLISLKLGEYFYLKGHCAESPVLLLDDIFSELDGRRAGRLYEFTNSLSQTFITTTNPDLFSSATLSDSGGKIINVENGTVL